MKLNFDFPSHDPRPHFSLEETDRGITMRAKFYKHEEPRDALAISLVGVDFAALLSTLSIRDLENLALLVDAQKKAAYEVLANVD